MNKFEIPNPSGGHKLKAHDLNLIYQYLKDGFTALSLKHGNAILNGLQYSIFSSNFIHYTSGWVMIGGEIYYYDAPLSNINLTTYPDPCLVPYEVAVSPSPRSMADSTSKNIHFKRQVRIENYAAQPVKFRLKELRNFGDPLHKVLPAGTGGVDFEYEAGVGEVVGNLDYLPLSIRRIDDELEITGMCKINSYASSSILVKMPTQYFGNEYKPKYNRSFTIAAKSSLASVTNHNMLIDVDRVSGDISVQSGSYSGSGSLFLIFNHKIPLLY